MESSEARAIVRSMIEELRDNPSQFHFEVNVSGVRATSHGGGTGLHVSATGGGPGSTTIGMQASVNSTDVEIAHGHANEAVLAQLNEILGTLTKMEAELGKSSPDGGSLRAMLERLSTSVLPSMITKALRAVLQRVDGIDLPAIVP